MLNLKDLLNEDLKITSEEDDSSFGVIDLEKTSEYFNKLNEEDREIDIMAKTAVLYDIIGIDKIAAAMPPSKLPMKEVRKRVAAFFGLGAVTGGVTGAALSTKNQNPPTEQQGE